MQHLSQRHLAVATVTATLVALALGTTHPDRAPALAPPNFDGAFWKHWGDGNAEVTGYDVIYPRYGHRRRGIAVTIFVTETFSNRLRVKADPGNHREADQFPVMKLNLITDFPTGIYDYNLMTSVFVAVAPVNGRPAGCPTKVSFSSQEWCGQAYHQLLFDNEFIDHQMHSYFDGQADNQARIDFPRNGVSEDTLMLWARGMAGPSVRPGARASVSILRSVQSAHLGHMPLTWMAAELSRSDDMKQLTVLGGDFTVRIAEARFTDGRVRTFYVEASPPHRVVKWSISDGEEAQMLRSTRLQYWKLNGPGKQTMLERLGLAPRALRTP